MTHVASGECGPNSASLCCDLCAVIFFPLSGAVSRRLVHGNLRVFFESALVCCHASDLC